MANTGSSQEIAGGYIKNAHVQVTYMPFYTMWRKTISDNFFLLEIWKQKVTLKHTFKSETYSTMKWTIRPSMNLF